MLISRTSLFTEQKREDQRAKLGNPLADLSEHVDFDALGARKESAALRSSRAKGGWLPYPTVLIIKILLLQQRCNLADNALEYPCWSDAAFCVFWI